MTGAMLFVWCEVKMTVNISCTISINVKTCSDAHVCVKKNPTEFIGKS